MRATRQENIFPPGRFTAGQRKALRQVINQCAGDPAYFADLEGTGPVSQLEDKMAALLGVRYVLALSSGTAAIHAALLGLGIGPGDEVIVTPYSWGQSVAPVFFTGATAVFADIDPDTLCLEPASAMEKISDRTKAILPVHLFGNMADMPALTEIAARHDIAVVADAAHALGATLDNKTPAQWGDAACFSLGRGKLVSGGEGGLLTTDDPDLYARALLMTQHPNRIFREFGHGFAGNGGFDLGYNYRIHPLGAVLALADLEIMEERLAHRRLVRLSFHQGLGNNPFLKAPAMTPGVNCAAYGIPLTFNADEAPVSRMDLVSAAQRNGIPLRCGPVGVPLHQRFGDDLMTPVTHQIRQASPCTVAEHRCGNEELWLLSTLDMDGVTSHEARVIGELLRKI